MTRDDFEPMRAALEQLVDVAGEQRAREILGAVGRRSAQLELERIVVMRLAMRLLEERAPRYVIRDRLVSRGVSWPTAYRVISAALDARAPSCLSDRPAVRTDADKLAEPQPSDDPCH